MITICNSIEISNQGQLSEEQRLLPIIKIWYLLFYILNSVSC